MGKELERYGGDMGMEGTRARRGHGYGRDMDMEGRDMGMEEAWVWRGQAHGWGHGYGGDNGIELTWV